MDCPKCDYETDSELGVKVHYGQTHEGSLSLTQITCEHCEAEYTERQTRVDRSEHNFCSRDCHDLWRKENISGSDAGGYDGGKETTACSHCGEPVAKYPSRIRENNFCSDGCLYEWRREQMDNDNPLRGVTGEDHPAWKGGVSQNFRLTKKWQRHREKVYQRDDYECQKCNASDTEVHAHHITPVHDGGEKYDMGNLITLCRECHVNLHKQLR